VRYITWWSADARALTYRKKRASERENYKPQQQQHVYLSGWVTTHFVLIYCHFTSRGYCINKKSAGELVQRNDIVDDSSRDPLSS
jgi:hypothetical protein